MEMEQVGPEGLMKAPRRPAFFIFSVIVIVIVPSWFLYEVYLPHTTYQGERAIEVPQGFGSRKIGGLLKSEGFIESKWAFVTYATLKNKASSLKPGTYVFSEESTVAEILEQLVKGEEFPNERFLTIPEGWNLRDIGFYFERNGIAQAEELWELAGFPAVNYTVTRDLPFPKDFSGGFSFLKEKPNAVGLEGYLFPDTYRVYRDASVEEVVRKMLSNFDRRLNADLRAAAAAQDKTIFEIVTVASLIEKEVPSDEDRALVSGILWKRLQLGIPLQVDATLTYIRGDNGPLTNADKASYSRFNTYRYRDLPLGPIANPGLSAIQAALNPKESSYLYYISAPPDGKTIFSRTLEEHNRAKAKYLR